MEKEDTWQVTDLLELLSQRQTECYCHALVYKFTFADNSSIRTTLTITCRPYLFNRNPRGAGISKNRKSWLCLRKLWDRRKLIINIRLRSNVRKCWLCEEKCFIEALAICDHHDLNDGLSQPTYIPWWEKPKMRTSGEMANAWMELHASAHSLHWPMSGYIQVDFKVRKFMQAAGANRHQQWYWNSCHTIPVLDLVAVSIASDIVDHDRKRILASSDETTEQPQPSLWKAIIEARLMCVKLCWKWSHRQRYRVPEESDIDVSTPRIRSNRKKRWTAILWGLFCGSHRTGKAENGQINRYKFVTKRKKPRPTEQAYSIRTEANNIISIWKKLSEARSIVLLFDEEATSVIGMNLKSVWQSL